MQPEAGLDLLDLGNKSHQKYSNDQRRQAHNQDRVPVSEAPASGEETGEKDQYRNPATYESQNVSDQQNAEAH
jgi:hypothetical protein